VIYMNKQVWMDLLRRINGLSVEELSTVIDYVDQLAKRRVQEVAEEVAKLDVSLRSEGKIK